MNATSADALSLLPPYRRTFSPGVTDQIGTYVYLLIDPRDSAIFYVGKGRGDCCFTHVGEARTTIADTKGDYSKLSRIREIEAIGASVRIELLRHGLSEREGLLLESAAIDLMGMQGLTNRVVGHEAAERGRMSIDDANALYGATPVAIDRRHRVVLIRINRLFTRGMTDDALYEATRKWWKVGAEARRIGTDRAPDWAMAVYGGVVRAVYRIKAWEKPTAEDAREAPSDAARWAFRGERDASMEETYLGRDISSYLRALDSGSPSQNPIRYVNCGREAAPISPSEAT